MMTFNLKSCWFDAILHGEKTTEYRAVTPYWEKRLKNLKSGDEILFRKGYLKSDERPGHETLIHKRFAGISIGPIYKHDRLRHDYSGFDGDFFRIDFT